MTSILAKHVFPTIFISIQITVALGVFLPEASIAADSSPTSIGGIQLSSNDPVSPQKIQAEADKINRELSKCNHYLGTFSPKIASAFGTNAASMVMYYDSNYAKHIANSYKKLILFFFWPDITYVDEYYPIRDKKYVVRYSLKMPLRQDQLNFETFSADYKKMGKNVLSRYVFLNDNLIVRVGKNGEIKEMLDLLNGPEAEEGKLLQRHEVIALDDVSMD